MKKTKQAFTLVELIVVITILAILGTIAFISLQGYSADARDSVRISDISKIKTSLELFQLDAGKYPDTTDPINITYSGAIVWTQGTFGENTFKNVEKLDKIPTDPLTNRQYVYSLTNTKQEYQIAGVMEGEIAYNSSPLTPLLWSRAGQVQAGEKKAVVKIIGNFNGKLQKVSTGGIDYLLAVPSVVTSSGTRLEEITANNLLAYNGFKNLPSQYGGSSYNVQGEENLNLVNSSNLVVYSGDLKVLSSTEPEGVLARKNLILKLQNAYGSTAIEGVSEIAQIVNTDIEDVAAIEFLSLTIVSNNLGGGIKSNSLGLTTITNSCDETTKPTDNGHISFLTGTPTSVKQEYLKDATNCGYTCTDGYTGTNCEIPPITGWSSKDPNCTINTDFTISGTDLLGNPITQVWAACNSTLGNGLIYSTSTNCYDYASTKNGGSSCNGYNTLESSYNSTYGIDNIWGKLYTWDNAPSACPEGWHLPSQLEWTILLKNLGCSDFGTDETNGWLCDGLGWANHKNRTDTNNLVNALKIPLAAHRSNDSSTFDYRGNYANFRSSSEYNNNGRGLFVNFDHSTVDRELLTKAYAFSVRCIKN